MKIEVMPRAEKELLFFQKRDKKIFLSLLEGIDELEEKGLSASNIKSLSGIGNGYRKRIGRCQGSFTVQQENDSAKIWIIAIEKDTKKDYQQWSSYIASKLN